MPYYLSTEKHWSTQEYSAFYVCWGIVGFFGLWLAGWPADRIGRRIGVVCVKFSKLVMVGRGGSFRSLEQHPFVRSETTIPSSRPGFQQSAARSGSQGCRRERGGTGGAGAQRP